MRTSSSVFTAGIVRLYQLSMDTFERQFLLQLQRLNHRYVTVNVRVFSDSNLLWWDHVQFHQTILQWTYISVGLFASEFSAFISRTRPQHKFAFGLTINIKEEEQTMQTRIDGSTKAQPLWSDVFFVYWLLSHGKCWLKIVLHL